MRLIFACAFVACAAPAGSAIAPPDGAVDAGSRVDVASRDAMVDAGPNADAEQFDANSGSGSAMPVTEPLACTNSIVDEKPSKNQIWTYVWGSVAVPGSDYVISGAVTGTDLTYFPTLGVCWSGDTCTGTFPPASSDVLAVYVCRVIEQVYSTGMVLGTDGSNDVMITW